MYGHCTYGTCVSSPAEEFYTGDIKYGTERVEKHKEFPVGDGGKMENKTEICLRFEIKKDMPQIRSCPFFMYVR